MGTYLLSLDQGTTSSRAILFDREQNILGVAQKEFTQFYPREGWVEHDPMEVWSSQYGVMMEVIAQSGVNPAEIAAIGITNQRETTILWDRATGRPIYNAIVWQCRRTAELVDRLRSSRHWTEHIRRRHRPVPGRVLLRHQDPMGARPCGGGPGKGPPGGDSVRHGGRLAAVEAHWRGRPRHRRHQRLPHHAL